MAHNNGRPDLYGVSATATIMSNYKRRGDYRVHVGVADSVGDVHTLCFTFGKGYRNRDGEDSGVAFMAGDHHPTPTPPNSLWGVNSSRPATLC